MNHHKLRCAAARQYLLQCVDTSVWVNVFRTTKRQLFVSGHTIGICGVCFCLIQVHVQASEPTT